MNGAIAASEDVWTVDTPACRTAQKPKTESATGLRQVHRPLTEDIENCFGKLPLSWEPQRQIVGRRASHNSHKTVKSLSIPGKHIPGIASWYLPWIVVPNGPITVTPESARLICCKRGRLVVSRVRLELTRQIYS